MNELNFKFSNEISYQGKPISIPEGPIKNGYGEYIIYKWEKDKPRCRISLEQYAQVHPILFSAKEQKSPEELPYDWIKKKVQEIDPSYRIAFVPKTVYALEFIQNCINEEVSKKANCLYTDKKYHAEFEKTKIENQSDQIIPPPESCWHKGCFSETVDINHPGVVELAYRLNKDLVKYVIPGKEGFTYKDIKEELTFQIKFFQEHHKKFRYREFKRLPEFTGPAINFGFEGSTPITPLGIADATHATILLRATAIECSLPAINSTLIYRGSDIVKDTTSYTTWKGEHLQKSLSFGSSLFAGALYDGSACAFHYMRQAKNHAYVILIPNQEAARAPFIIPDECSIRQLCSYGEYFHGRTKIAKQEGDNVGGVFASTQKDIQRLFSENSEEEIKKTFEEYKKNAIHLK